MSDAGARSVCWTAESEAERRPPHPIRLKIEKAVKKEYLKTWACFIIMFSPYKRGKATLPEERQLQKIPLRNFFSLLESTQQSRVYNTGIIKSDAIAL